MSELFRRSTRKATLAGRGGTRASTRGWCCWTWRGCGRGASTSGPPAPTPWPGSATSTSTPAASGTRSGGEWLLEFFNVKIYADILFLDAIASLHSGILSITYHFDVLSQSLLTFNCHASNTVIHCHILGTVMQAKLSCSMHAV